MPEPHIVILGAGPAGVGGAYQLRRQNRARVTVLEQNPVVGGNAGSFTLDGLRVDFGSHRLHPACEPGILTDIRGFLGADLLDRPRHGRIGLRGRWIHFPLKPVDLLLRLDPGFAAGTLSDMLAKPFRGTAKGDTFASVLWANLGPTICRDFYFPYARKIWGRAPEELSGIQARRRVSAGSFVKLLRKVLGAVPGFKAPGAGRFYYPRQGFGQISEAYAEAAVRAGAELRLGARVTGLGPRSGVPGWTVTTEDGGRHDADYLWSTIPITTLARAMPDTPPEVQAAAGRISYRAMLLVYLVLDVAQFTEYDAHYFPDARIRITRLSEPKNYGLATLPGKTVLCAELPCEADDATWKLDDFALGQLVTEDLARAGVPLPRPPIGVVVRRLRQAYPIYLNGYETPLGVLDGWAEQLPRALSYGRQGLFAHDNTHHALFMAYAAAECMETTGFNDAKWAEYRRIFATHVVED